MDADVATRNSRSLHLAQPTAKDWPSAALGLGAAALPAAHEQAGGRWPHRLRLQGSRPRLVAAMILFQRSLSAALQRQGAVRALLSDSSRPCV